MLIVHGSTCVRFSIQTEKNVIILFYSSASFILFIFFIPLRTYMPPHIHLAITGVDRYSCKKLCNFLFER